MSTQPTGKQEAIADGRTPGIVRHVLHREVNEQINSVNHGFGVGDFEQVIVICECSHVSCAATVGMTVAEYEGVRRFPTRFFVKEGHEIGADERVVAELDGYVVVETNGRAGVHAVGSDPRRRSPRSVEAGA